MAIDLKQIPIELQAAAIMASATVLAGRLADHPAHQAGMLMSPRKITDADKEIAGMARSILEAFLAEQPAEKA